jgi:hypothetical protein
VLCSKLYAVNLKKRNFCRNFTEPIWTKSESVIWRKRKFTKLTFETTKIKCAGERCNVIGKHRIYTQSQFTNVFFVHSYFRAVFFLKVKAVPQHTNGGAGGRVCIAPTHSRLLGTKWRWVVSFTPRPLFIPGERSPGTHCAGGWVGPQPVWTQRLEEKIMLLLPEIEPRSPCRPVRSQTLYWLSYPAPF